VRLNDEISAAHQPRLISADSAAFQPSLEMSDEEKLRKQQKAPHVN